MSSRSCPSSGGPGSRQAGRYPGRGGARRRPLLRLPALLLLLLAGGCRPPTLPQAVEPEREPAVVYVDVARLLPQHPGSAQLRALDEQIAALRGADPSASARPRAPLPPDTRPLDSDIEPLPPGEPALPPDRAGAADAVREDFGVRRKALPDPAEDGYYRELERLKRRFLELRREPTIREPERELEAAVRRAEERAVLERELRDLDERPTDRLLFPAAELVRRRERRKEVQVALDGLRRAELARLERALQPPEREPPPQIPPELLERARQARDEERRRAAEALAEEERREVERVTSVELPPPTIEAELSPGGGLELPPPPRLMERANRSPMTRPAAGAARGASLKALQQRRAALRARLLEDLRAAALSLGKAEGLAVSFTNGAREDATARLAPKIRSAVGG